MKKFESTHNGVEVVQVASWVPGFINRQIIILLLALGVTEEVFKDRAQEMLDTLNEMLVDGPTAVRAYGVHL